MCRALCVLFVVILGSAAVRFSEGYGTDNSAYLHHNDESENNNGEDKTGNLTDSNKKCDSVSVTDDQEKLDERYVTDDSNRNGCKISDKQVNSYSKTTTTNSDTAPITIGLSGSSYITEKSIIDENSSKTENDSSNVKEPNYSSSFSIIEHSSDGMSSSNNFKTEITSTDSDTKHLMTVDLSSDASVDKQGDINKLLSNNGYESFVLTTISNIPLVRKIADKEEIKSSTFNSNDKDQTTSSNNFKTDAMSDENDEVTTGLPPFVSGSGIDVKNEFKSSSNNNNAHSNSESLTNSYSNFQTDRKSTNLDENIAVATSYSVLKSKDGEKNSIDARSPTSAASLIEATSKTPYIGGSKLDTKEATIPIKSDSITHNVHISDNKISDSSFEHFKSTTESINYQNNYSAVGSHTTGDSIAIVKPIPNDKEVKKNEHISGANHKIQTDKNKENSSIILVIVDENKYGRFEVDKGGHEVHHYIAGHRYSHESDSSDNSDESDESWERDHNRHHQYNGHHYSHESDSSDDSSIESNERWVEGHNFRFYGHEYDNNDAAEDLGDSWVG